MCGSKMSEGGAELGQLRIEMIDLRLGDCGRELSVRSFGLFMSVEGSETCTSSVHRGLTVNVDVVCLSRRHSEASPAPIIMPKPDPV